MGTRVKTLEQYKREIKAMIPVYTRIPEGPHIVWVSKNKMPADIERTQESFEGNKAFL